MLSFSLQSLQRFLSKICERKWKNTKVIERIETHMEQDEWKLYKFWWIKVYSVLWLLSFHFIHIILKWKVWLFESFLKQSPFFLQNHVFWEEVFRHQTKHLTWFVRESFGGKQFSCIQNSILLDYSIFWSLATYWLDSILRPYSFESMKKISFNHFSSHYFDLCLRTPLSQYEKDEFQSWALMTGNIISNIPQIPNACSQMRL